MASATFVYRSLESSNTIRLLKVLPELDDGVISCEIEHFSKHDIANLKYIALSYCWGDTEGGPESLIHMRYKGDPTVHRKAIFENLWRLLRQLRMSEERTSFYYWMDALCLNQDCNDEKAKQVLRMGTIFSEALRTLSWLGCPDIEDKWFSRSMGSLPGWITENRPEVDKVFGSLSAIAFKQGLGDDTRSSLLPARDDLRGLGVARIEPAMRGILSNPYWRRVWIIQEVALSRRVEIMFGAHCLDFEDFLIAYKPWVAFMRSDSIRPAAIQARMDLPVHRISFDAVGI